MQPANIDPTFDLCTRYPLRLGGLRHCGIQSLPNTSTHDQHWESNPRPSDLKSNSLSTGPHAPTTFYRCHRLFNINACCNTKLRLIISQQKTISSTAGNIHFNLIVVFVDLSLSLSMVSYVRMTEGKVNAILLGHNPLV